MPVERRFGQMDANKKSTFLVHVMYRQNASWQGEIQWMDGKRTKRFRSLLELINLMKEAMEKTDAPKAVYRLRSWDDADTEEE